MLSSLDLFTEEKGPMSAVNAQKNLREWTIYVTTNAFTKANIVIDSYLFERIREDNLYCFFKRSAYQCHICHKMFSIKYSLKVHLEAHEKVSFHSFLNGLDGLCNLAVIFVQRKVQTLARNVDKNSIVVIYFRVTCVQNTQQHPSSSLAVRKRKI